MEALGERYVIQETLFEGEGAVAWVGLDLEAGALVVIARLRPRWPDDEGKRLAGHIDALSRIGEWRLVAVEGEEVYLAGEYDPDQPYTAADATALLGVVAALSGCEVEQEEPHEEAVEPGKGGFTLVQLMIVVALIGIGAAVLIPMFVDVEETPAEVEAEP